jgi:hypothetical protein
MLTKELMVGDWVYVTSARDLKPRPCLITCIWENGYVSFGGNIDTLNLSVWTLEPIPLTREILLKNGFSIQEESGYVGMIETRVTVWGEGGFSIEYKLPEKKYYYGDVVIEYVHEFQHLLRLCRMDKEIVL